MFLGKNPQKYAFSQPITAVLASCWSLHKLWTQMQSANPIHDPFLCYLVLNFKMCIIRSRKVLVSRIFICSEFCTFNIYLRTPLFISNEIKICCTFYQSRLEKLQHLLELAVWNSQILMFSKITFKNLSKFGYFLRFPSFCSL